MGKTQSRAVLVATSHRGVFFGLVDAKADLTQRTLALRDARMAIKFGTTGGVAELAATGPTSLSRVGAKADLPILHDVTAVWDVSDVARLVWESYP